MELELDLKLILNIVDLLKNKDEQGLKDLLNKTDLTTLQDLLTDLEIYSGHGDFSEFGRIYAIPCEENFKLRIEIRKVLNKKVPNQIELADMEGKRYHKAVEIIEKRIEEREEFIKGLNEQIDALHIIRDDLRKKESDADDKYVSLKWGD